ncbi:MAG: lysophospholipid acyltransferase family protein [Candidatus Eisenbacteria bacterium]|nr:lysophospholipid acyltransferase family protein [Candidatus Eisenbacteria bacterium]
MATRLTTLEDGDLFSDACASIVIRALNGLAVRAPRREAKGIAALLGTLRLRLRPREARAVRGNLALLKASRGSAPGDRVEESAVRSVFRSWALFVVEFFCGLEMPPEEISSGWTITGEEHLAFLRDARKGFILATAHTGNWEHLRAIGWRYGRRILSPAGIQFHGALSRAVKASKARQGVLSTSPENGMRALAVALAEGQIVGLPFDGSSFRRGIIVPFLGMDCAFPAGPARLAMLTGCPIVPIFARRTGFLRQEVRIGVPLYARAEEGAHGNAHAHGNAARTRASEARRLTAQLAQQLAAHLEMAADQWCIFRPITHAGSEGASRPPQR